MTKARWWFAAMALVLAAPLMAQDAAPAHAAGQTTVVNGERIRVEPTVVVVGEQPGPGMWIVRKGSHDLYLLGTLTP
ncbi:MAG: TraB/GumN family protein, partial [Proteobacteria bacterium]|nr:TraB/GumN family protein [Pseudomonadota bacterium]